ncbi:hypothetical protein B0H11DRAFT_178132 [Mycena galericulata]|nr:hypothetical protein B0H11DRAFT_178132 [Mycena galericulata]
MQDRLSAYLVVLQGCPQLQSKYCYKDKRKIHLPKRLEYSSKLGCVEWTMASFLHFRWPHRETIENATGWNARNANIGQNKVRMRINVIIGRLTVTNCRHTRKHSKRINLEATHCLSSSRPFPSHLFLYMSSPRLRASSPLSRLLAASVSARPPRLPRR